MRYLPVFLDIAGRRAVVIGAGVVAGRKAELLLEAGAAVELIAPECSAAVAELAGRGLVRFTAAAFAPEQLDGAVLVIGATDDVAVNAAIADAAAARGIPCNVVDNVELSGFILPALVQRGRVQVAVSTEGASPVLARLIKQRLEATLPGALADLAEATAAFRPKVRARIADGAARRRFWEACLEETFRSEGAWTGAELIARWQRALDRFVAQTGAAEEAESGALQIATISRTDPDAVTLGELRSLATADVVLHEAEIPESLLALARREAERRALPSREALPGMLDAIARQQPRTATRVAVLLAG